MYISKIFQLLRESLTFKDWMNLNSCKKQNSVTIIKKKNTKNISMLSY